MKKLLLILVMLFPAYSFSQNYGWIMPGSSYMKIRIAEDGMYRISKSDFVNAGLPVSFDPRTAKLFHKGIQLPFYFRGEQDGVFNDGDYINFYAQRNYGGEVISRESNNLPAYSTQEFFNNYSDTSVYWLGWGGSQGLRYAQSGLSSTVPYPLNYFTDSLHIETDAVYSLGENLGPNDFRYLTTEKLKGEGWYWALLNPGQSVSRTFSLPRLLTGPANAGIRIFAYPRNRNTSVTNEHSLILSINGNVIDTLFTNDTDRIDTTVYFQSSLLNSGSQNNAEVRYLSASGFSGSIYFDLMEITYPSAFALESGKLGFNLLQQDTASRIFSVQGFNSGRPVSIFDVRNNLHITQFMVSGDTLKFTARSNAKIEIVNDTITRTPLRMSARIVPDLVSSLNGADYLILYNRIFEQQAEQLRLYRQNRDGYRAFKAEIEDVYDIFNFGIEDPVAVRNFVRHVYANWQTPRLGYLTLFGRGSLDPKKIKSNSAFHNNYVPVYGNPPSDNYFTNQNGSSFFYNTPIAVGRIPAYYASEAQSAVEKTIAYESVPYGDWNKEYTFITGGGTPFEQYYHQQRSEFESFFYVEQPPLSSVSNKIYRSDTSGTVTFNYADSIRRTIDSGTIFVSFRGHAGSHDWEVGMRDPNVLNNGNKLPLVLSLTCFTGENALPDFRGFGERFIYLQGKGAIGFLGTTGWSFADNGNTFGTYMLLGIKSDTLRRLGDIVKYAGNQMSRDSSLFSVTHTVNCYNLLGDPAARLRMPKTPELSVTESDYTLLRESMLPGTRQTVTFYTKNYGLNADSCAVRFELILNNNVIQAVDSIYRSLDYKDTLSFSFTPEFSDIYKLSITLDRNNKFAEENEADNSITLTLPVKSTTFIPMSPVDNSLVFGDTVELSGLNPNLSGGLSDSKVIVELDTVMNFNSPFKRTFVRNNPEGQVTKFRTPLPANSEGRLYFWRTASVIGGDSSGWSESTVFVYAGSVVSSDGEDRFINSQLNSNITKFRKEQFRTGDMHGVFHDGTGIRLRQRNAGLFVRSYGSNGEEASFFSAGSRNIFIDGGQNSGLNLTKVKKVSGEILQFLNLKFNSQASNDTLLNFLNTFDSTHYLMLLNAAYVPGGVTLSAQARNKLRQFGSVKCDSIGLISYFHTWSFIGFLGAQPSDVSEMFDPCCRPAPNCVACDHWTESVSSKNVVFKETSGKLDNIVGPASSWQSFSWDHVSPPGSSIRFDVYGIRHSGTDTLLMQGITSNKFADISSVNAAVFPRLNLVARFEIDQNSGMESPLLKTLNVDLSPAAELLLESGSLTVGNADRDAQAVNFSFRYGNAGYVFVNKTRVEVFRNTIADSARIYEDTVDYILKMDSSLSYAGSFADNQAGEAVRYIFRVTPAYPLGEFHEFNNSSYRDLADRMLSESKDGGFVLTLDGREIKGGEIVSARPEALLRKKGNSSVTDTDSLNIFVNSVRIPYTAVSDAPVTRDSEDKMFAFRPELSSGKNRITLIYTNAQSSPDSLVFEVSSGGEEVVSELYNYPNPMRENTSFIFSADPESDMKEFSIKIYAVSGRLIREIRSVAVAGLNSVQWNGRDGDGDIVANGTYLYRLSFTDGINRFEETRKLVILR